MKHDTPRRGTFSAGGRRLLLLLCVTALIVGGTFGRGVPAAFAAPAPTILTVTAVSGTYGGTATVSANLSSTGIPITGRSVDIHIGATDLGPVVTDINGNATIPAASLAFINVGTYTGDVTASFAGDVSFDPSSGSNDLTVTPVPLTITADDQTKVYGAAVPTLTATYTGFVNGDTAASLTTAPTITTTATAASHVAGSPYSITVSGVVDFNYSISYVAGSLTVTTAPLTITADNQTKVYGAALPTLTASYSGFVNGDTAASLTTAPTITTTANAASHSAGNPYTITASGAVDADYTISYVAGSLNVTSTPLTITADNQTKVYGDALPTLTASYTGFVNGDTAASLTTQPTITTTATAASHVAGSPYAITASGAVDSDYTISYVAGSLSITTAPLTITADNQTKVYGAALPTLTASYTGFVNGDTSANLTTAPTINTSATAASSVAGSPYAITASGAVDPDYAISYVAGSLSITPAPLTITAYDQTKLYGDAVPTLGVHYSGFVNGETSASLTTPPTATTTATAASPVSGNPYSITASGAVDPNYAFSYVAGSLTVTPAPLTITADNQTKVYGAALPVLTASYTGFVNGDTSASLTTPLTCTTTATIASLPGGYPITCSGAVDADYTISYVAGSLTIPIPPVTNPPTITKITPVITWATPADITFGTALGTGQLNASTYVPGTFTYSSPAGSVLAIGTQLLTVLFVPFDTADYNAASALVYINVVAVPQIAATATAVPATPSPTPVAQTAAAPHATATVTATATATPTVAPAMTIHNQRHTIVGGLTTSCSLSRNLALPFQPGCVTVSTVWMPGAHITYTITYPDGTTQHSTDIADARGHSLQVFAVRYVPPVGARRGPKTIAHITAVGTLGTLTAQAAVRFAAIR